VQRERSALDELLCGVKAICCTLTVAASAEVESDKGEINRHSLLSAFLRKFAAFDYVVIDECCQVGSSGFGSKFLPTCSTLRQLNLPVGPPCCWANGAFWPATPTSWRRPFSRRSQPTVFAESFTRNQVFCRAGGDGFARTIMQRIGEEFPAEFLAREMCRLLTRQFRMHRAIMHWSSAQMYNNQLEADESVADHLLMHVLLNTLTTCCLIICFRQIAGVVDDENTRNPLIFIDTAGCDLNEIACTNDASKANIGKICHQINVKLRRFGI